MELKFKNNFFGYFSFYYSVLGNRLLLNMLLSVLISLLDGMGLAMFMPLLQAVGGGPTDVGEESMGHLHYLTDAIHGLGFELNLDTVLGVLVVVFTVKGILRFVQSSYQVRIRQVFLRTVRYRLVDGLQHLHYQGFLSMDSGRIQNSMTTEVNKLYQGMNYYFNAAQSSLMLSTYISLAFLANYQFALLVAIGAGASNFLYRRIYNSTKRISIQVSKKGDKFNSYLMQAIHNFKYLKSTNYFALFSARLKEVITSSEKLVRKTGMYSAITNSVKEPMIIIIIALVIEMQIRWMGANLSTILLSLLLFYRALTYLIVIQNQWQYFVQNIGSMDSVSSILHDMHTKREVMASQPFETIQKGVELRNIRFSYGEVHVLKDVSIRLNKNQTIALVGESGSGKTTLANILAGLLTPQGDVLMDGVPLRNYDVDSYRSKIGYIAQDPVIFNDDIYNNVTFWAEPTAENMQRFWEIIELTSLKDFLQSLPDKEKTNLGDNGLLISGGQKQRISIARELYKKAEILILDEATSALDSETEKIIQTNIEKLHGQYTIVIIAHRLSTIKNADTIYLLENGYLSDSGTFEAMLTTSAKFNRMVKLQEVN
jgi:subfamily B ATP-binding cassette protein MsbA